jgi:Cro/C1-type HTH DNA-binding domain
MLQAIRVRMAEVGIRSQAALNRAAEVPEGTMKPRWEGKRGFGLDLLDALAPALKLSVADLVERAEVLRAGSGESPRLADARSQFENWAEQEVNKLTRSDDTGTGRQKANGG